ncbi:FAD-dependent monooxygenase [Embleya sp. NPDC055664]
MTVADVDVLVVGAGPAGLSTAVLLGRLGISTRVVERRAAGSAHPKAHVVNARTMELFRQWGVADEVRDAALPLDRGIGVGWVTRLTGIEIGRITAADAPDEWDRMCADSSEALVSCPQDRIEPILLAAARRLGVRVDFGVEATGLGQTPAGVDVRVRHAADGGTETVRARYVVAADGARSPVRELLAIGNDAVAPVGHLLNAYVDADLGPYTGGRPYALWWILNARTQGAMIALDGKRRWTYNFAFDPERESIADYPPERCAELFREAVGVPDLAVTVRSVLPWKLEIAIAERFRAGRVFLVGDAAHRFPPTGGFGMNTGIQDAHNLAWKLAAVLRGWAGEELLAGYEDERMPVARVNAAQSMRNAERMAGTGALFTDPSVLASIEDAAGKDLRAALAAGIPAQRDHFLFQGQTFGHVYRSAAVVPDGTLAPRSTVAEYRMEAHPGALAPHTWFRTPEGARRATVDLSADTFVLLAGAEGRAWVEAADVASRRLGVPIAAFRVGADGDLVAEADGWRHVWGITPHGCVLVRPDGHVALRVPGAGADGVADLIPALRAVLGRRAEAEAPADTLDPADPAFP